MIPNVTIKVQDNGLGQQNPGSGNLLVVVGVGSGGATPVNVPVTSAAAGAFVQAAGYGPGPQLAELVLKASGGPVVFVQETATTPGANTAVFAAPDNTGTGVVTVAGSPVDTIYGVVTVAVGGTIGAGPVQIAVSVDAGRTTLATKNLGTATTFAIPNTGLTLTLSGAPATGDQFYWVSTEPQASNASASSAVQSLASLPFGETPVTIYDAGCAATGGDVTAADLDCAALATNRRYISRTVAARDAAWGGTSTENEGAWMTSIEAGHVNDSTLNVGVSAGHYNVISAIDGSQYRRPLSWVAAVRQAQVAIQVDLGRVADGALSPVVVPTTKTWPAPTSCAGSPDGFLYHDEAKNPGLDAARFMSAITYPGFPGFYVCDPQLMAPPGSDFQDQDHKLVVNAACLIWYMFATERLRSGVRVNTKTGNVYEVDRQSVQYQGTQALRNILTPGNVVSDVYVVMSPGANILATQSWPATVYVVPLGKLVAIPTTITFLNPALVQV